ncbi:MAG: avidin/streptavidin family protein [Chromatiaceae bacterium]|jgi:hypothetical protein|nr:avidin/streptavidin family protein [Chromatiaceae bacterium]
MKANQFSPAIALTCVAFAASANASGCEMPSGKTWVNELGSTMMATVDSKGAISGTYATAVGCGAGVERPMTGFCNGHAVTFSVNWQECSATNAWSGTYDNRELKTLWHLVNGEKPAWNSILAGTDTFKAE